MFTVLFLLILSSPTPRANHDVYTQKFAADVRVLASDEMEGRGLGTQGLDRAAAWIEKRLRQQKLSPAFGTSYRQPFQVKTGVTLEEGNQLSGVAAEDWTPLGFSSSGEFNGELAFVGYGIDAAPIGYRELEGLNLKGKVALILRYEPQEKDDGSPFDGRRPSRWSAMRYKGLQARERGAAAVIFVTGPLQDEEKQKLPALTNDGPESPAGIPILQVKTAVAQKWLSAAGIDLAEFQRAIDRDLRPRSRDSLGVRLNGRVALKASYVETANVAGVLKGKGALADEVVVIGAHYDHLGYGGTGSMRPNTKAIHNGADDNASGTVAVLLAAERMRELLADSASHRTIVFALFSAEEVGLAGSSHFVAQPPLPLKRVVAMINLDMVGSLKDNRLIALGAESAPQWNDAIATAARAVGVEVTSRGDGYGPSDQTSFYAQRIPVLHFFTGAHQRYHTPDDDAEAINFAGGAKIAELTATIGAELARGEVNPTYARSSAAPAMQGDSRGYGAYLGTVPDFSAMEGSGGGVLLADVRTGSPADLAGIRGGDRLIDLAGTRIENLYDMTYALQDHRPGETVDLVVLRNGEKVKLRATLGSRTRTEAAPAAAPPAAHPTSAPAPAEKPGSFYDNRPGKDFAIKAGKPFESRFDGEGHLTDIRQLTFSGENAEAYFSPDGTKLIYQATVEPGKCDQQYVLDLATGETSLVSTGRGRTTCGYYDWPEADRLIYSSTHQGGADCPPPADRSKGYVWSIYDSYDIYEAALDGSNPRRLTTTKGYDAEATWCHRGGKLVFTSVRDGDLELYEMNEAGETRRLTNTPGYDGGAFYSPDCSEIVWRASRPQGAALDEYRQLLAQNLVKPSALEIFVMNADGTNVRQVTSNGAANFGPYFHPDGRRIIYSSNLGSTSGREFDLWMVDKAGGNAERITTAEGFDGFPMWSPDGLYLVFASNRANPKAHQTNLFIARWVE